MLQLNVLRATTDEVKKQLAIKNFTDINLVDTVIALDDERKKVQLAFDNTQAKINAASKEIGKLMAQGNKEDAENNKSAVSNWKQEVATLNTKLIDIEKQLHDTLVLLPNLPHHTVPAGKTAEDNEVAKEGGTKPNLFAEALPHWDLIKQYNLVDFEIGAKITGSGFPLYKAQGAKLQRALIQYFLDYNTAAGYTEFIPPFMVNETKCL
jgi:seryl-tRNA synthetase